MWGGEQSLALLWWSLQVEDDAAFAFCFLKRREVWPLHSSGKDAWPVCGCVCVWVRRVSGGGAWFV